MWQERYNWLGSSGLGAVLAAMLATGCAPDGPGTSVPTHPSDRYSLTLEWDAPTEDAVGRPLDDLSGYRLYYREVGQPIEAATKVEVGPETRITISSLVAGDFLFAVTALDTLGNESDLSDPLPVTVGP